ncbi:MAG TPA: protein kinase [Clostridia bacterium]|nr:protein kinase [Clostridia bacterium]
MHEPQKHPIFRELSGTIAGRFRVIKILGSGGMGQVYQAEDLTLKRLVAIKRMAFNGQLSDHDREALLREAQRASALNHPNIASIYDVVEDGGELLLVMECVDGMSLRQKTESGAITLDEFFDVGEQCAEALAAAHERSILHADVKPENIMLTPTGRVKILDFGVARKFTLVDEQQATSSLDTLAFSSSGTPAYMSPEILTQRPYDGRADIFSLGVVFYETLGGQQPFQADSIAGTLGRVLHENPPLVTELNANVGAQLSSLVGQMLAKDPDRRYPSAKSLVEDLRRIKAGGKPKVIFARDRSRSAGWAPRTAWIITAIAALIVVTGGLLWWRALNVSHSEKTGVAIEEQTSAAPKTLAVLPFDAVSNDPKMTAFGNGLVDSLTAKLTQLAENHPIQVVSADEIRKKGVLRLEEARQEFGAHLGLKVALQRSGDLVHVTYTVSDTKTAKVIKAENLDAPVTDPFSIENKITDGVASALRIQLTAEERRVFAFHGTSNADAYNYFTQAEGYLEDASNPSNADSAVILLTEALKADPKYGKAEAELGMAYWSKFETTKDKKFIAQARGACLKAVAAGNSGASGHECLGVLENGTGNYEKAAGQFKRALELEATNDGAYVGLGSAYERLQSPREAESTYQRLVKLRPTYWKGYNLLGGFYLRQGQFDQATQMFQKVLELTPESFRGYANLGATYLYQAKYQDAIKSFEQSLAIRPTAATYLNLGTAYYHSRQFGEAARIYKQSVLLNDKNYVAWGNLAEALYLAGRRDEARAAYLKAIDIAMQGLKVNPHDPQMLKDMADYSAMTGERAKALKYLEQALQYSKYDKETLFAAALIYNQLGETGPALEWLRKSMQAGYSVDTVKDSPSLGNLRNNPQFEELIKTR